MPGILNRPVFSIGLASSAASAFNIDGIEYDYAINGQPFLSAVRDNQPLLRKLVPIKKDQFDNSHDPGEQSLTGWWLRSQSSWHAGAGLIYQEPSLDPLHNYRFASSAGVDVWTPGKLSLLTSSSLKISAGGSTPLRGVCSGSTDIVLMADGTTLRTWDGTSASTITWGGASTLLSLADDGSNYYAADNVGIWKGALPSGAGSKIWNTGSNAVTMEWCKQRLVAGIGPSIYELVGTGPTLPTAKYTHPNANWTWTSITDSPGAILAAGSAGNQSAIYKFVLGSDGSMPTLTSGVLVAELPKGEIVNSIASYLGVYLGICTSKGVRIATVDDNGNVNVGPLTVKVTGGVKSAAGNDRFLYFGWKGGISGIAGTTSGLGRIDLSLLTTSIQTFSTGPITGIFAYASDTYDPSNAQNGDITSVVAFGKSGLMAYSLDSYGLCVQSPTAYFTSGYVEGGRIRYDTLEPKIFKYVRLRSAVIPTGATESVNVIDQLLTSIPVISYSAGNQPVDDVLISANDTNQESMAVRVNLTSDGTAAHQPVVYGWQLKALPGSIRQIQIQMPLLCYDFETDRGGTKEGYEHRAEARLAALEALAKQSGAVLLQDLCAGTSELVLIDDMQYQSTASPVPGCEGTGGVVTLLLRTVT